MDAFYASVEAILDPTLTGRPVIVGGLGPRGVVASCSYEARVHGVHSAMPSTQARRLCPHAVFLPGHYDRYAEYSQRIHRVFESVTPLVEPIALDEAFLDVTAARLMLGDGPQIAAWIRQTLEEQFGLRSAVGVARNKLLAKLASKQAKPTVGPGGIAPGAGVVVVQPDEELAFLHPLPVRALWGVGPATHRRLARFGVATIGDLAQVPAPSLVTALGRAAGEHLHELSWGRDDRPVEPNRAVKSVGHEETYERDLHEAGELHNEAVRLCDAVSSRLRQAGVAGRTITVKIRFHDFATITRSHSLPAPVDTGPNIARVAVELLSTVDVSPGVRLLGVTVSGLTAGAPRQLALAGLGHDDEGWDRVSIAVDAVRSRFGDRAVGPAALVGRGGLRVKRRGDTRWGPKPEPPTV
jgi:DNA polymerase-4